MKSHSFLSEKETCDAFGESYTSVEQEEDSEDGNSMFILQFYIIRGWICRILVFFSSLGWICRISVFFSGLYEDILLLRPEFSDSGSNMLKLRFMSCRSFYIEGFVYLGFAFFYNK